MNKTINLEEEGTVDLSINGKTFKVDTTDIECINALTAFNQKYNGKLDTQLSTEFIVECKVLINKVLGPMSYETLFPKPTLKAYLLCFELVNVYQIGLVDIYSASLEKTARDIHKIATQAKKDIDQLNKIEEVKRKYGVSKDHASKKNKGKKS